MVDLSQLVDEQWYWSKRSGSNSRWVCWGLVVLECLVAVLLEPVLSLYLVYHVLCLIVIPCVLDYLESLDVRSVSFKHLPWSKDPLPNSYYKSFVLVRTTFINGEERVEISLFVRLHKESHHLYAVSSILIQLFLCESHDWVVKDRVYLHSLMELLH